MHAKNVMLNEINMPDTKGQILYVSIYIRYLEQTNSEGK